MLVELLVMAIGFAMMGISIVALHTQIKKQARATSTQVCMGFFARLRDEDFRKMSKRIREGDSFDLKEDRDDWTDLHRYLNHFEHIAIIEDKEVIESDDVYSFFSGYLGPIDKHEQVAKFIESVTGRKWIYLKKLLKANDRYLS